MPRSRISNGLHRTGLVLAAIPFLFGVALGVEEARRPTGTKKNIEELSSSERKYLRDGYEISNINAGTTPIAENDDFWLFDASIAGEYPKRFNWEPLVWCGLTALLVYGAFRSLGWVIDGFRA